MLDNRTEEHKQIAEGKCKKHPKYQMINKPKSDCAICHEMFKLKKAGYYRMHFFLNH